MWGSSDREIKDKLTDEGLIIRNIFEVEKSKICDMAVGSPTYAPNQEIEIRFYEYDLETGRIWCNYPLEIEMPNEEPIFTLIIRVNDINSIEDVDSFFDQSLEHHLERRNHKMSEDKINGREPE